jgi:Asp-tRNA(Asn)/Glu-tRNA(Gln) amidotransferase C subunit
MKRHRCIPTKPTWSTSIFLRKSENHFTEQHTARLANRAMIRIEAAQFTQEINDFVAMVSPILSIETEIEPLVSITSKINTIKLTELEEEDGPKTTQKKLLKHSNQIHQGYYHIL